MEFPDHMLGEDHPATPGLKQRLRETFARIGAQVDANVALEKERRAALDWCRANGNPHQEESE